MTVIILKNGTTSINIECAGLTYLEYWEDSNIYKCEYSDWAFGLFAMLTVFVILIPIVLFIQCGIRWYHKQLDKKFKPNISRQTSYSSLYPPESRANHERSDNQEQDIVYHHPKKKTYYPYPAYGTYDELSLPGSTPSLYFPDTLDGKDPSIGNPQNIPPRIPSMNNVPTYLSSSCPTVGSHLKEIRDTLHEAGKVQNDTVQSSSLRNSGKSRESLENYNRDLHKSLKPDLAPSFSASSTSNSSRPHSVLDDFLVENEDDTEPIKPFKRTNSMLDKNRILCATPPRNMTTRQDFDDYLADCVMKLPEDQRNGTFLVRNSTTVPNCKVLTMFSKSIENNASLYYFKIYFRDDGKCFLEETKESFQSIDELIAHYRINRSVLPCLLTECLGRNF